MKFKILAILGCILILTCAFFFSPFILSFLPSKKQSLANLVRAKASEKIESTKNLHLIGTGGQMLYNIEMLNLGFECFYEVDIPAARELLVYSVTTLINEVNANQDIRPYLKNYPFTANNIEIDIWIRTPENSKVALGKLRYLQSKQGLLEYNIQTTDNFNTEPILTETYEEAVNKLGLHD